MTNLDKKIKLKNLGPVAVCDEMYELVLERALLVANGNISGYIRILIAGDLLKLSRFQDMPEPQAALEILALLD